jgi:hypothetical protein
VAAALTTAPLRLACFILGSATAQLTCRSVPDAVAAAETNYATDGYASRLFTSPSDAHDDIARRAIDPLAFSGAAAGAPPALQLLSLPGPALVSRVDAEADESILRWTGRLPWLLQRSSPRIGDPATMNDRGHGHEGPDRHTASGGSLPLLQQLLHRRSHSLGSLSLHGSGSESLLNQLPPLGTSGASGSFHVLHTSMESLPSLPSGIAADSASVDGNDTPMPASGAASQHSRIHSAGGDTPGQSSTIHPLDGEPTAGGLASAAILCSELIVLDPDPALQLALVPPTASGEGEDAWTPALACVMLLAGAGAPVDFEHDADDDAAEGTEHSHPSAAAPLLSRATPLQLEALCRAVEVCVCAQATIVTAPGVSAGRSAKAPPLLTSGVRMVRHRLDRARHASAALSRRSVSVGGTQRSLPSDWTAESTRTHAASVATTPSPHQQHIAKERSSFCIGADDWQCNTQLLEAFLPRVLMAAEAYSRSFPRASSAAVATISRALQGALIARVASALSLMARKTASEPVDFLSERRVILGCIRTARELLPPADAMRVLRSGLVTASAHLDRVWCDIPLLRPPEDVDLRDVASIISPAQDPVPSQQQIRKPGPVHSHRAKEHATATAAISDARPK